MVIIDNPVACLKDVSFAYPSSGKQSTRKILSNINMDFTRGQVIAIMGASGCGKTTILRLLSGQLTPTNGVVNFLGNNLSKFNLDELYKARQRMGMLFQFGALFQDISVYENVAFPLREHTNLPENLLHDLVLLKLNAVGLRGARDLMPAQISGGMARKVALARAIALDPELVLYDEPFAGLDPISLGVTAHLIRSLNDIFASTSILVSHDVKESFAIADYVYFLANGIVYAQGSPEQILAMLDPLVCQFFGALPDGPASFHYPARDLREDFSLL